MFWRLQKPDYTAIARKADCQATRRATRATPIGPTGRTSRSSRWPSGDAVSSATPGFRGAGWVYADEMLSHGRPMRLRRPLRVLACWRVSVAACSSDPPLSHGRRLDVGSPSAASSIRFATVVGLKVARVGRLRATFGASGRRECGPKTCPRDPSPPKSPPAIYEKFRAGRGPNERCRRPSAEGSFDSRRRTRQCRRSG